MKTADKIQVIPKVQKKNAEEKRRARQCTGKIRFDSESHATWALKDMAYAGARITVKTMHPYPCRFCQGWHLGHNDKRFLNPRLDELVKEITELLTDT